MEIGKIQNNWLKALESDNYKQGRGMLMNKNGEYCCLGVACVMINAEIRSGDGVLRRDEWNALGLKGGAGDINDVTFKECEKYFPEYINDDGDEPGFLVKLNDNGATFKQIAHFIRENPERVFVKSI